jgi:molybdopterin converting factor small subunit
MAIVYIPVQLRELTGGQAQISAGGTTVRDVVADLDLRFPGLQQRLCKAGELSPSLQVSIDGTLSRRGLDAKVPAEAEVHFLPVFGGG